MGNLLLGSMSTPADPKTVRIDKKQPEKLFVTEQDAYPAEWSTEGYCAIIQRFFGMLPASEGEIRKQQQQVPFFYGSIFRTIHTHSAISIAKDASEAVLKLQRVYRRYRILRKWRSVTSRTLKVARRRLEIRKAITEEETVLSNFRQILINGFSASKVSHNGKLKPIVFQLVLKTGTEECYLTWKPSKKKNPKIHLHDIEEVIPVQKNGSKEFARLVEKVSYRRGIIVKCKSYHRGRIVLEMTNAKERNLLVHGFHRLLEDLNRFDPNLDATGIIRKRLPRRQTLMEFFDQSSSNSIATPDQIETEVERRTSFLNYSAAEVHEKDTSSLASAIADGEGQGEYQASSTADECSNEKHEKKRKANNSTMEKYYQTRFDTELEKQLNPRRPELTRGLSMPAM